jgi:hypothetical protein
MDNVAAQAVRAFPVRTVAEIVRGGERFPIERRVCMIAPHTGTGLLCFTRGSAYRHAGGSLDLMR